MQMTENIARIVEEAELISDFEFGQRIIASGILEDGELGIITGYPSQTMVF